MNAKSKKSRVPAWFCRECGHESISYLGKCPACQSWNSFVEQPTTKTNLSASRSPSLGNNGVEPSLSVARPLQEVSTEEAQRRLDTGFAELNNVLGGGLLPGCFLLIGGDPGIGKSTLLLQTMANLAERGHTVLYVSGEESPQQVKNRAERLQIKPTLYFLAETDLERISAEIARLQPEVVVIDSIQVIQLPEQDSLPGSPGQIRQSGNLLMRLAKQNEISVIVVGHITKEGQLAGPKLLEHMVDAVLYFEGDKQNYLRLLRSVKNRFGPTEEVGLFEMSERGLQEVQNPSALFLSSGQDSGRQLLPGTVVTATLQGSRIVLAEIQALVGYTVYPQPKRLVNGIDYQRANQITAVLERRLNLPLSKQDVYTNVVGGLQIEEPAVDLAVGLAITSCLRNTSLSDGLIAVGEVGLTGEVRGVTRLEQRLKEAARLGFRRALIPARNELTAAPTAMQLLPVASLGEAVQRAFRG